ncbi:MAG TPA: PP2C family protein-serine/threonine phosphatase [Arachnia sp.]|nr:PP2C family protein-serine/threonine phosphatase [Arachnia sp.]HMT87247.1 PP2C family protein-serine/threonine phosphatase [Arachnia sp.]
MTNSRDHYGLTPSSWVAGCSDVGLRHASNQDAMSLAVHDDPPRVVIAVADGVSTAYGSERASLAAVAACEDSLLRALERGHPGTESFTAAFEAADRAVGLAAGDDEPSACTLIAAVVTPGLLTVGNVGDSRAYWVGDDGESHQLSSDDSMAAARMMMGMTREEAENSHQAHAITRWLGRQTPGIAPTMCALPIGSPGWLVVCTDGLWNYASAPEDLARLVRWVCEHSEDAGSVAATLVDWAKEQGGKDNVTVVVARCTP